MHVFSSLGPTLPVLFFPAVMAVAHDNEDEKYFGLDAFAPEVRNRCQLRHPMIPSRTVNKFSIDPIALQGILEKIFKVFRQGFAMSLKFDNDNSNDTQAGDPKHVNHSNFFGPRSVPILQSKFGTSSVPFPFQK